MKSSYSYKIFCKCPKCGKEEYIPSYCIMKGLWCGEITNYIVLECCKNKWRLNL